MSSDQNERHEWKPWVWRDTPPTPVMGSRGGSAIVAAHECVRCHVTETRERYADGSAAPRAETLPPCRPVQRCGDCRWFETSRPPAICAIPVPHWLPAGTYRGIDPHDGSTCPCFSRRQP